MFDTVDWVIDPQKPVSDRCLVGRLFQSNLLISL